MVHGVAEGSDTTEVTQQQKDGWAANVKCPGPALHTS